jgi:hypothetical protein
MQNQKVNFWCFLFLYPVTAIYYSIVKKINGSFYIYKRHNSEYGLFSLKTINIVFNRKKYRKEIIIQVDILAKKWWKLRKCNFFASLKVPIFLYSDPQPFFERWNETLKYLRTKPKINNDTYPWETRLYFWKL